MTREGFRGKDANELYSKFNAALQILLEEPWFTLALSTKHISRAYQSYVRSILLYGAELLTHSDRKTLVEVDDKMLGIFFNRLLKMGRGKLASRHVWRVQLTLGLSSLEMELDALVEGIIDAWLERRTSCNEKVANHPNESLDNVTSLS